MSIDIFKTKNKRIWNLFKKHHYLSHSHNNSAQVFVAFFNETPIGFISVLHLPHSKVKNIKKVHRLVLLPDYQGMGIGVRLLNEVGKHFIEQGFRYTIATSSSALIFALKRLNEWKAKFQGRQPGGTRTSRIHKGKKNTSTHRRTVSFEYKPAKTANG